MCEAIPWLSLGWTKPAKEWRKVVAKGDDFAVSACYNSEFVWRHFQTYPGKNSDDILHPTSRWVSIRASDGHSADFSLDISWSIFFTYDICMYLYISIFIRMRLPRMLWAIETTGCISTLRFSYAKVCRCFVTTPRQGGHRWIKCLMFGVDGFKPGMVYGWVQQIPCQWAQWAKQLNSNLSEFQS